MRIEHIQRKDTIVRSARAEEAPAVYAILEAAANRGEILPRTRSEVTGTIDQWQVVVQGAEIVGCGCFHSYNHKLAEFRSLVVVSTARKTGIGTMLVTALIDMAIGRGLAEVFVLTRRTDFFRKFGFMPTSRERFPEKMRQFCRHCPKLTDCNERTLVLNLANYTLKAKRGGEFQVQEMAETS